MRHPILVVPTVLLLFAHAAKADFVVTGPESLAARQPQAREVAPSGASLPGATGSAEPVPDQARPDKPRFKMAYGFGNEVRLSFACKQIVPPAVRVTFGPGADPQALVDWKGGDTWSHVLRNAVQPLGLHLVMTWMAVEIRN
jgi:hypothetical protein